MKSLIQTLVLLLITVQQTLADTAPEQFVQIGNLKNLYCVDSVLYRSEQPQSGDFREIEKLGIKTVIDLRNRFDDHHELKKTGLKGLHFPINSWKINYGHLVAVLRLIVTAEKPVLIHCLHGADRTGCVVACYRMVFSDWSKEDAIREFLDPKFGYHDGWFPRMKNLLESVDTGKLKEDVLN